MDTQEKREKGRTGKSPSPLCTSAAGEGRSFFSVPVRAWLMECIEETGSMQEACTKMGLSYSKAAKMMKKAEKQLGFQTSGTQDRRKRRRRLKAYGRRKGAPEKIPGTDTPCAGGC